MEQHSVTLGNEGSGFATAGDARAARVPELDGVRGIAIILVLIFHLLRVQSDHEIVQAWNSLAKSLWVGVDLFFVLSGYLITSILISRRSQRNYFRGFYIRRVLRVWPAYYLVLIVTLVLMTVTQGVEQPTSPPVPVWPFFFHVQNWTYALYEVYDLRDPIKDIVHLWSLGVEEQFYLIWPVVVLMTPPRRLAAVCAGVFCVVGLLKVVALFAALPVNFIYCSTPTRMDALAIGAWLAAVAGASGGIPLRQLRIVALLACVLLITLMLIGRGFHIHTVGLGGTSMLALLFAALLAEALAGPPGGVFRRMLRTPWLGFWGLYSYGLYLIHSWPAHVLKPGLNEAWSSALGAEAAQLSAGIFILLVSIVAAMTMYHLWERPFLRLKNSVD